jgi:hypothetical protein
MALKEAVAPPARTVTDPGTVRLALLSLSATEVLEATCWFNVTVHVELAGVFRDVGLQLRPFKLTGTPPVTVMVPPVPVIGMALAASEAPKVFVSDIDVPLVTVGERVTVTILTTPSGTTLELIPVRRQV